jgi:hypothetical protein
VTRLSAKGNELKQYIMLQSFKRYASANLSTFFLFYCSNLQIFQLTSSRGSCSIVLIYNLLQLIFPRCSFSIVLIYKLLQLISSRCSFSIVCKHTIKLHIGSKYIRTTTKETIAQTVQKTYNRNGTMWND